MDNESPPTKRQKKEDTTLNSQPYCGTAVVNKQDIESWLSNKSSTYSLQQLTSSADFTPEFAYFVVTKKHVFENKSERAKKLITEWLKTEPSSCAGDFEHTKPTSNKSNNKNKNESPASCYSLERLASQRVAMLLFSRALECIEKVDKDITEEVLDQKLVDDGNDIQQLLDNSKLEALKRLVISSSENYNNCDDSIRNSILDELLVFLVVYDLFVDFRIHTEEPFEASDLSLPVDHGWCDCWWPNRGQHDVAETVPWYGRGVLANIGLLGHALVCNLSKRNTDGPTIVDRGDELPRAELQRSFEYLSWPMLLTLLENVKKHPLGLTAAAKSITALITFVMFDDGLCEAQYYDLETYILPTLKNLLDESAINPSKIVRANETEDERVSKLILKCKEDISGMDECRKCLSLVNAVAANPFVSEELTAGTEMTTTEYLKLWYTKLRAFLSEEDEDELCYGVDRIRLQGNHSREYLLTVAVSFPDLTILVLQDCTFLDERILDAMTSRLKKIRCLLLKGCVNIRQDSQVVANIRAKRCLVDFSGTRCQYCGR